MLMDPIGNSTEVPLTLDILPSNSMTSTPRRRDPDVLEAIGQALNEYNLSASDYNKDMS